MPQLHEWGVRSVRQGSAEDWAFWPGKCDLGDEESIKAAYARAAEKVRGLPHLCQNDANRWVG